MKIDLFYTGVFVPGSAGSLLQGLQRRSFGRPDFRHASSAEFAAPLREQVERFNRQEVDLLKIRDHAGMRWRCQSADLFILFEEKHARLAVLIDAKDFELVKGVWSPTV